MVRFLDFLPFGRESSQVADESGHSRFRMRFSCNDPEHRDQNQTSVSSSSSPSSLPTSVRSNANPGPLVLLIYWAQGIGCDNLSEVNRMEAVFRIHYQYTTRIIEISQQDPFNSVNDVFGDFQRNLQSSAQLLIVYYIGHGILGDNMRFLMSPHLDQNQNPMAVPTLDWSTIQVNLQNIDCDVLILLDTCHAASAIAASRTSNSNSRGRTEIIAACGYESTTPGPTRGETIDQNTFSRALAAGLHMQANKQSPFSAAILYRGILEGIVINQVRFEQAIPNYLAQAIPKSPTPLHVVLGNDYNNPGITLRPSGAAPRPRSAEVDAEESGVDVEFDDQVRDDPRPGKQLVHVGMSGGNGLSGLTSRGDPPVYIPTGAARV